MRQLTSLDAQFIAMETPRTFGHVSGFAIYDPSTAPGGRVALEDVTGMLEQRLHLLPPFKWRLVEVPFGLDYPYWIEDPDFSLDFHVRETAVAPPGGRHQLAEQVARIVARPLDRSRPLWELYLIHGLEGDRIGMLTKVHHAAVDGMSGAEIMSIILDLSPAGRDVPPPEAESSGDRVPGGVEMLGRGLLGLPRQPLRAALGLPSVLSGLEGVDIYRTLPGVGTVSRAARRLTRGNRDGGVLEGGSVRAPRTRFNGRVSAHRRFAFGSLSLAKVKAIKNELGVTVNDVVMAICAGALRDTLIDFGELPDEPLVAMIPVSVRSEEEMGTFGNRVSAMIVPIPTDEPDPRKRLMRVHDAMRSAKERHSALPADLLQDASHFVPPALLARSNRVIAQLAGVERFRPAINLTISNVPGPQLPLFCAGAKLEANYPVSVITDGVGLNITVLSYMGHLDFGIVADREQIDDIWPLLDRLCHSLEELDEAVCGKPAATRPAQMPVTV